MKLAQKVGEIAPGKLLVADTAVFHLLAIGPIRNDRQPDCMPACAAGRPLYHRRGSEYNSFRLVLSSQSLTRGAGLSTGGVPHLTLGEKGIRSAVIEMCHLTDSCFCAMIPRLLERVA